MNIKLIGCASTMNEVHRLGLLENIDGEFFDFDLHARPKLLHVKIQEVIDRSQDYDLIVLTYSRCSNLLLNLVSPQVAMVFPNTHDCIGLLLGSNRRHHQLQTTDPAVYYFSQGWLDYAKTPYVEYLEYVEKFGENTARSLIDTIYGGYKKAVLIITPGMEDIPPYRKKMQVITDFFGWETEEVHGDMDLLTALFHYPDHPAVIKIPPGVTINEEHFAEQDPGNHQW